MTDARKSRGWTVYSMCKRMNGVYPTTIRNLEGNEPTRETDGINVKLLTAIEICSVLWPDLQLADFYGKQNFKLLLRLVPDTTQGTRRLLEERQKSWG